MIRAVGIGDLHYGSRLSQFIHNIDEVITDEIRTVLDYARSKAIKFAFFYGDISDTHVLSSQACQHILDLDREYPEIKKIFLKGNHDSQSEHDKVSSLSHLDYLSRYKYCPTIKVVAEAPRTFFSNTDTPVHFLPWPHSTTHKNHLNVLHVEAVGAKWDTGRPVTHGYTSKDLCAVGHIHTAQVVGNSHFSGTLYQTNFGEAPEKYFHDITWTGNLKTSKIELVPHKPKYTLKNAVVKTQADYTELIDTIKDSEKTDLWKVFVHSKKVTLPANAFDKLDTVVRINPFSTKEELQSMIHEELELTDAAPIQTDMKSTLVEWMEAKSVEKVRQERVLKKYDSLIGAKT